MPTDFFLIGDSHAHALALCARKMNLPFRGGPLGAGRQLQDRFFEIQNKEFRLLGSLAERQDRFSGLLTFDGPILTTIGFNSHAFANSFSRHLETVGATLDQFSDALFETCVTDSRKGALAFYQAMADQGRTVYFTCSPQRIGVERYSALARFEKVLISKVMATGAQFIDVRPQIMKGTDVALQFQSKTDAVHGSEAWAALVLEALLQKTRRRNRLTGWLSRSSAVSR